MLFLHMGGLRKMVCFIVFLFPSNPGSSVCQVIPADGGWILEPFGLLKHSKHFQADPGRDEMCVFLFLESRGVAVFFSGCQQKFGKTMYPYFPIEVHVS